MKLINNEYPDENTTCKSHGKYTAKIAYLGEHKITSTCPECSREENKKQADQKKDELAAKRRQIQIDFLEDANIIKRYWDMTLDDYKPREFQKNAHEKCLNFASRFDEMCSKGQCVIFCGGVGTGKTMLLSALIQSLRVGYYIRAVDISRNVRHAYSSNESELDVIEELANQRLLVIDEVGLQQNTKAEALLITDLIDRRYGNMVATILITNLDEEGVKESFGPRAFSRMMQKGAIISINGESQR